MNSQQRVIDIARVIDDHIPGVKEYLQQWDEIVDKLQAYCNTLHNEIPLTYVNDAEFVNDCASLFDSVNQHAIAVIQARQIFDKLVDALIQSGIISANEIK